jgi:hypothetical protein
MDSTNTAEESMFFFFYHASCFSLAEIAQVRIIAEISVGLSFMFMFWKKFEILYFQ